MIAVRGSAAPPVEWIPLRAGPLTMQFDPENLWLRYIRRGEREILRSVYGAVRDQNWGTVRPRVSNFRVDAGSDTFRLEFDAECIENEIEFFWKGTVLGEANGTVRFTFDGQARSTFLRNRIGLCVLHPLVECAGQPCRVEHVDGTHETSAFPKLISPSQPIQGIQALTHDVGSDLKAEVRFAGEVFEMEDQRNWTDASFKTYSTPLELPFPVRVETGQCVRQEVRLTLIGDAPPSARVAAESPTLTVLEPTVPKPPIGLCVASHGQPLSPREVQRLQSVGLSHLRVDLAPSEADWAAQLNRAAQDAARLGVGLHAALHLTGAADRELEQLLAELARSRPRILLWILFHTGEKATSQRWVQLAREKLGRYDPSIPLAAGTNAYFAELNRNRPVPDSIALPCYSLNPQVHAFDDASLIENLGGQADTVHTAWDFAQRPVVVSPVTLRPRFNPNATALPGQPQGSELPAEVDVRQLSLLGAAWTLGSLAQLITTGRLHSVTYFETTGWRGVMETEAGSPLPGRFPSIPASVFPVFHVLADLAGFSRLGKVESSAPLSAVGLALENEQHGVRVLIASLQSRPQLLRLRLDRPWVRIRILDERNVSQAMQHPEEFRAAVGHRAELKGGVLELQMPAFAIACLDHQP